MSEHTLMPDGAYECLTEVDGQRPGPGIPITNIRVTGVPQNMRMYGPKRDDHITVGDFCVACGDTFTPGDFTTLLPLGPGHDQEKQEKAAQGRAYNAVAIELHWSCVTGELASEDMELEE